MRLEQKKSNEKNTLQQDAREAFEKVCGKEIRSKKEVEHMTLEGMQKRIKRKIQNIKWNMSIH